MSNDQVQSKKRTGFATLSPEALRELASRGGKAVHAKGKAHQWTSQEAKAAGKKGGDIISQNKEHMARIGALGGKSSNQARLARLGENDCPTLPAPPPSSGDQDHQTE